MVTLSPNSLRLLRSMNIMETIEQKCMTPFYDMLVYEQVGQSYMRFNNAKHKQSSKLVQLQEQAMSTFLFDTQSQTAFNETQENMGASIETQHL